jgi:rhamnosyl/mannosyltransferase
MSFSYNRTESADAEAKPAATGARRKILHIGKYYPPHPGGIETHLEALCRSLKPWFDCEVLVANDTRRTRVETLDGIPVKRLAAWFNLAGAPACPVMVREIAESRADLVHIQWPNPAAFLAYLASGHRGPLVVSWQSDVVRQRFLNVLFAPVAKAVLRRADCIVASSPNYAATSSILRGFADRVRVVPIAISIDRFRRLDSARIARIRERYGPRIVLAVGRLVYYKGFEYLVRAARRIDCSILIVGEGPLRHRLESEIRSHRVSDKVHLLGEVDDIVSLYQACEVFVLPSIARSEAFGIVQLEAMACGKPVVNTRLDTGVTYVSPDGISGITVAPRDEEALAGAINRLLVDRGMRERYGQAGLRRVQTEFSLDLVAGRMRELYEEVLISTTAPKPAVV